MQRVAGAKMPNIIISNVLISMEIAQQLFLLFVISIKTACIDLKIFFFNVTLSQMSEFYDQFSGTIKSLDCLGPSMSKTTTQRLSQI